METLETLPTPDHITLLFKRHKSTVVLSVLPNTSFSTIKQALLAALHSRGLPSLPGSDIPLPENADELELGVLKDRKDPSKGWLSLDVNATEISEPKGGKRKSTSKSSAANNTPADIGLSDNNLVAYRLKSERAARDSEDEMIDILDDPAWDVILPIYEDDAEEEA